MQETYRYLLVDEYQDTNGPQYEIVRRLAQAHRNLCVVGDDDQSIYGWRGADVTKILNFEKDFAPVTTVRLETNYRSTNQILNAANAVIRNNRARHDKALRSAIGDGADVRIICAEDEENEVDRVIIGIQASRRRFKARLSDFAILVRTAQQPRAFEARLRQEHLPYILVGGMSFFDRKEIRDVLSFLKLAANPDDESALLRIINTPPRGIGKTTIDRVLAFATEHGISVNKAFERGEEIEGVSKSARQAVGNLRQILVDAVEKHGRDLVALIKHIVEAVEYRREVERVYDTNAERDARWATVTEVFNFAENHARRRRGASLLTFLEALTLQANDSERDDRGENDAITLMTLHAAKGLEFPRVFLVGVEEGILPHARSVKEDTIEEERRLMYVGITRAQEHLTITHAKSRAKFGKRRRAHASRFLFEMTGTAPPTDWCAYGMDPPEPDPDAPPPDDEKEEAVSAAPARRPRARKKGQSKTAKTGTRRRSRRTR
jgi:superfamily I DNA/RNA helicase